MLMFGGSYAQHHKGVVFLATNMGALCDIMCCMNGSLTETSAFVFFCLSIIVFHPGLRLIGILLRMKTLFVDILAHLTLASASLFLSLKLGIPARHP